MKSRLPILLFLISYGCNSQDNASEIVLVNGGSARRAELAKLVEEIDQLGPKVISIDFQFSSEQDAEIDNKLIDALGKCKNLVMVSVIDDYSPDRLFHKRLIPGCLPKFTRNAKLGFVNLILESDNLMTLKRFSQLEYVDGNTEFSFALRTAYQYDSLTTGLYMKTHNNFNEVDFSKGIAQFKRLSADDFLTKNVSRNEIMGKIVMIGFLGPGMEDKFYSPIPGPKAPNIYGLEFHAQVVSQILRD